MQLKKIALVAEPEYVGSAPHNAHGSRTTVSSIHLAASIPNFLILATIGASEDSAWMAEIARPALRFEDDLLLVHAGPGLGIELNREACKCYPYQPFEGWR